MFKLKNMIIAVYILLLTILGCNNISNKVIPDNSPKLYGVNVGGPGVNQQHPIYGNDGTFGYIALGNSNMEGVYNFVIPDTISTFLSKSWNNTADAWVTMNYAKTTAATQMFDAYTSMQAHPPFHFAKAVCDKYGVPARGIIRASGGLDMEDFMGSGTASAMYDSIRTQLTASGLTEIDAIIIQLGECVDDIAKDQQDFIDDIMILLRQLWAEPEIDSMRTKIIFGELTHQYYTAGASNYQNGALSNINYITQNPYVGTAPSKFLPNGGVDYIHYIASSNVIRGRDRFFNAMEAMPIYPQQNGIERSSILALSGDGTYVDCVDASIYGGAFQHYYVGNGLNLAKSGTVGNYSLSSDGLTLTINMDGNLIAVKSVSCTTQDMGNSSIVYTWFPSAMVNSSYNMDITIQQMGTQVGIDLLGVGLQSGDKLTLFINYLTKR